MTSPMHRTAVPKKNGNTMRAFVKSKRVVASGGGATVVHDPKQAGQHTCAGCGAPFVMRANATPEQSWLGVWFDHAPVAKWSCERIRDSILEPSVELLAQERQLHEQHHATHPNLVTAYCRRVQCEASRDNSPEDQ